MKRTIEQCGPIPAIDKLDGKEKLDFANLLQHMATVQLLLLQGGECILDADEDTFDKCVKMKFGYSGAGNNKIRIKLLHSDEVTKMLAAAKEKQEKGAKPDA